MHSVIGNKRILGLVALFILITLFLVIYLPSTTNFTSVQRAWAISSTPQESQGAEVKSNETHDDDFVYPDYEYSYESIAEIAADKKESKDPCEDVILPDGGRTVKSGDGTKVLVTGGAGFIGSNLVDRLLADGYKVNILDNLYTGFIRNVPLDNPNVRFILGDILDPIMLKKAMDDVEYVYHLAAMSKVVPSLKSSAMARFCTESNALGSWNVLDVARQSAIKKVVYAASSTYYGNHPAPHREDMPPDFLTPYAASKYEGEIQMQMFDTLFGVPTISTRFFMVYGPRQPSTGAYAIVTGVFAKQAADGLPLTIEGDGSHYRDFIHVSDIVDGLIIAQQSNELRGDVINLGSGTSYTVQDVADLVSSDQTHVAPRLNDLEGTLANTCKQKRLLGHTAKKDFVKEMSYMVKETMAGNVFMQSWLREGHALAVPHIMAPGAPTFGWPEDNTDLNALLLSLQHLQERFESRDHIKKEDALLKTRRLSVLLFSIEQKDSEELQIQLLMNTVYSLVRFGRVTQYFVAAGDDVALAKCVALNMPCYDARHLSTPSLVAYLVNRNYDVHLAQVGNSYISSITEAYSGLIHEYTSAEILGASPSGDVFVVANDRTRSTLTSWAQKESQSDFASSKMHSIADWPDLKLTKAEYPMERYCGNKWITYAEDPVGTGGSPGSSYDEGTKESKGKDDMDEDNTHEVSESSSSKTATNKAKTANGDAHKTQVENEAAAVKESFSNNNQPGDKAFGEKEESDKKHSKSHNTRKRDSSRPVQQSGCETRFYNSVACEDEYLPALKDVNATIKALKHVQAWHLTQCMDQEHCDLQQIIPRSWIEHHPDLSEFGGIC